MSLRPEDLQEYAQTTADFLNMRYFDGILQFKVVMHAKFSKQWYARFQQATDSIIVNPSMCHATNYEIEAILTHELMHVAQKAMKLPINHGPSFRQIGKDFSIPTEMCGRCANMAKIRSPIEMKAGKEPKHEPKD